MRCEHVGRELQRFLDGELGRWRRGSVGRHLTGCPGCHEGYRLELAVRIAVASTCREDVPPHLPSRITGALGLDDPRMPG